MLRQPDVRDVGEAKEVRRRQKSARARARAISASVEAKVTGSVMTAPTADDLHTGRRRGFVRWVRSPDEAVSTAGEPTDNYRRYAPPRTFR
jgi:hypothetical protein